MVKWIVMRDSNDHPTESESITFRIEKPILDELR
jgi:hypothetical protein